MKRTAALKTSIQAHLPIIASTILLLRVSSFVTILNHTAIVLSYLSSFNPPENDGLRPVVKHLLWGDQLTQIRSPGNTTRAPSS